MMFSCDRYDNIQTKAFNDINEVGYIKFQTGNMIEKPKLFFANDSLEALNMFGQFLLRDFESRKQRK